MALHLVPVSFRQACEFTRMHHRHHEPPRGMKFAIGAADDDGVLVGVAMAGRAAGGAVGRVVDNGQTLEVNRVTTDGTRDACSLLYGAAWRAAKALGYTRLVTYTQDGETGASLRAAGWRVVAERPAHPGWDRPSRRRTNRAESMPRTLWEAS